MVIAFAVGSFERHIFQRRRIIDVCCLMYRQVVYAMPAENRSNSFFDTRRGESWLLMLKKEEINPFLKSA